ncbi:MAG: hypothetical protein L3J54_12790 [Draconibacterium sp.]|nr:hypothetical protein [Draconibacterium sp.]
MKLRLFVLIVKDVKIVVAVSNARIVDLDYNVDLFNKLKEFKKNIANSENILLFVVFGNVIGVANVNYDKTNMNFRIF